MDKPMTNISFRIMAWMFAVRDLISPRDRILEEIPLKEGYRVLDYGCGPGGYTFPAARMVGGTGIVFALDIHPLAVKRIERISRKKGIGNIETINSDCRTGLPGKSIDLVLLYDIYHDLSEPERVLNEIHRVLKPEGILSFNDHHLADDDIKGIFSRSKKFQFLRKGFKSLIFRRI